MSKRRIHLTEGQLHRLIESTLNELDYKTYGNAIKKAVKGRIDSEDDTSPKGELARRKYERQYYKFWDKAHDEFKKKHGEDFKGFDVNCPIELDGERAREDLDNFVNGRSRYIKGKGWSESVARRVTESVMRKLKRGLTEWIEDDDDNVDDMLEFDDAKDALDFIKKYIDGHEELSINSDALYFGLGDVYTWDDMAKEFMGSPEARNANIVRGKNDAFLHFGNDATLLAYLRWLQNKDGYLCFITNSDEDGKPRPVEDYLW